MMTLSHRTIAGISSFALALIVELPPSAFAAENLGRLFFTAQQRQDLDYRRQANVRDSAVTQENDVTVNGNVSRSSGRNTTWVNGVPQDDIRTTRDPAHVRIPSAEGQRSTEIKVGQTLDRSRGRIKEEIGGGVMVTPSNGAQVR